eukprot:TRINITY_DN3355_c0_g1_i2.p1 TRINITY_DN3355_c0_g1~~TRINITY_DN3355_c0_g1_i2.p1  ORF type:complete len:154 (-),score=17.94 TRINITY_DN3355_c0_g1_i2:76-537(-)
MYGEQGPNVRETIMSYLSGITFAVGWWLWIDANALHAVEKDEVSITFWHWVPGIIATIALFMINAVSWTDLQGFGFGSLDDDVQKRARLWLFFSFAIAFGCVTASIWIAIVHWFQIEGSNSWPGIAIILQTLLILGSAVFYRFSRWPTDYETY